MLQDLDPELEAIRAAAPVVASGADKNLDPELEAMRRVESGGSLADMGFKLLTDQDVDEGLESLQVERGFLENIRVKRTDSPFLGPAFVAMDGTQVQRGLARMQTGKATIEDERTVWRWMVSEARDNTSGGTIAELLKSIVTSGAEMVTGAGVAMALTKGATKAAMNAGLRATLSQSLQRNAATAVARHIEDVAIDTGISLSYRSALAEAGKIAAKGAAAIGTTVGLQEAIPRMAGMEGGAWTAQSVMRAVGMEMTPEQAQQVADDANAAMPMLLEAGGGLINGMIRQGIQMGSEATGGLLGKLPVIRQVEFAFGVLLKKLSGRANAVGWQKALAEAAQYQGPGGQTAEEFFAAGAEAAIMGDKPIIEALAEVAEVTPEMLAAFAIPGAAGAGITRATRRRGTIQPSAPKALGSEEGGGPAPAAPEASVEGAAAVDPELARQDVEAYTGAVKRATGRDVTMRAVEGELTAEEAAVRGFLRRRNVEVTFIEPEGEMDTAGLPVGFFPSEGRAVVMRGANVAGPAMDEAMHTWESQQTPERRAEYGAALRELDPTFVGQVSRWVAQQPLYQGAAPELLAEEMRTNVARFTAGLVMYLDTPQGRADFETLWAKEPGKIRRALSALYDWVADKIRVLPKSKQAMARARLRVARNEQDVTKVAMRVLEALNEIRPVAAEGVATAAPQAAPAAPAAASTTGQTFAGPTGPLGPPVTTAQARQRYGMPGATGFMSAIRDRAPDPRNAQFATQMARQRYGMPGQLAPVLFERPAEPETAPMAAAPVEAAPAPVREPRRTDTPEQRRANRAARKARAAERVAQAAAEKQRIADERQRRRDERLGIKERVERASRRKTERVVEDTDRPIDWEAETTADIREFGLGPERPGDRFAAAYHGSPHKFDRFDISKIGTGEGAQAYGHGLYFAGKKEIAEHYRDALARQMLVDENGNEWAAEEHELEAYGVLVRNNGDVAAARRDMLAEIEWVQGDYPGDPYPAARRATLRRAIGALADVAKTKISTKVSKHLYRVDLAPSEDEYLLWDKPLSEQSEKVRTALITLFRERMIPTGIGFDGEGIGYEGSRLYRELEREVSQQWNRRSSKASAEASKALLGAGIRGIKYLDNMSRGAGEGSYNYVIFDDSDIKIEERFAAPLPPTITVDGKKRPTTNSDGRPIAANEEALRAFWRWFGDSEVVDGKGRPLVVYHGTTEDFHEFSVQTTARGFFFTPDRATADYYSPDGAEKTKSVYLRVAKLADLDDADVLREIADDAFGGTASQNSDDVRDAEQRAYKKIAQNESFMALLDAGARKNDPSYDPDEPLEVGDFESVEWYFERGANDWIPREITAVVEQEVARVPAVDEELDAVIEAYGSQDFYMEYQDGIMDAAQRLGYDGVVMTDPSSTGDPTSYVVFDAVQIKSATGNQGTFDPANADIRFAAPLPPTITVDGKERPTTNSDGRPIAANEEALRAFWRWFGDSKVVDDQGRPLLLYHGTNDRFTRFSTREADLSQYGVRAFYATDSPYVASGYTVRSTSSERLAQRRFDRASAKWRRFLATHRIDSYFPDVADSYFLDYVLRAFEQLTLPRGAGGPGLAESLARQAARLGDRVDTAYRDLRRASGKGWDDDSGTRAGANVMPVYMRVVAPQETNAGGMDWSEIMLPVHQRAAKTGADGLIVRDVTDTANGEPVPSTVVVVFDPTQIKSATGNQGTFAPANADIRFAAPDSRTPRQFTWSEYFAPERTAAQFGMGDDPERNVPPPRSRKSLLETPSDADVTEFLQIANRAVEENETPRQGTIGRPDLNVPLRDQGTRALLRAIDEQRLLTQESIPNEQTHELARALFAADPEAARQMVEDRLARNEPLSAVDTVVATKVMQALADRAVSPEGTREDFIDFMRWGNAYREARADTARTLQIVRGLGLAGQVAMLDLLAMPAPQVRKEIREIHKKAPGVLGKQLKARKSRYLLGQMGRPATGDKFAAAFDRQTGRPIEQERIDFLQSRLDEIEAQEAERMERAKQALQAAGYDLSQVTAKMLMDPNEGPKIRRIVSIAKASGQDKLGEYMIASMLSGPYTHVKNTIGNLANLVMSGPVQLVAEAMTNSVLRDKKSAQWGDVKAYFQGLMHALKPAMLNAMHAWRTESPAYEIDLLAKGVQVDGVQQKLDSFTGPAIGNPIVGRGLRSVSLNLLLASDEFFKTLAATAWAHALAYRTAKGEGLTGNALAVRSAELLNDYTGDLWVESVYKARETTFQDEGNDFTEAAVNTVLSFRDMVDDIGKNTIRLPVGRMLLPFVRTPLRIAATTIRRSPLQPLTYLGAAGGRYKFNKRQLVADTADTMIAMGLLAVAMQLVDFEDDEGRPFITGSTPKDKAERDLMFRIGIPPMSVRVGDTYYSYKNVEPLSTTFGVLVDALKAQKASGDPLQIMSGVLSGLVAQSKDKTFLRTLADLQELAEQSTSRDQRLLNMASYSFVSVWVPNVIKQPARAADPLVRERTQPVEGQSVWYEAAKRMPYDALPIGAMAPEAKHDLWGRPIEKNPGTNMATGLLARLLNPVPKVGDISTASKLDLTLLNYNNRVEAGEFEGERPVYPSAPSKTFERDGKQHIWSPEEYVELVRRSGELARQRLDSAVQSGDIDWRNPTPKDIDRIKREISSARGRVSREMWRARRAAAR